MSLGSITGNDYDSFCIFVYNSGNSGVNSSLGYFYNTLTPTKVMQDKGSGSLMKLYWSIENTLIDSQEIFLMD